MLEAFSEILSVLSRNKLRMFLTALSVAWGMFMLALLLGAGRGLENGVTWEFRDGAIATIWVNAGQTSLPYAGRSPGRAIRYTTEDYEAIGREVSGIEHRTGRFNALGELRVSHGAKHAVFDVRGTHPGHRYLEKTEIVRGRFLNDADLRERRKVAAIGTAVREALFGQSNPLGEQIGIRGKNYLVIGEFEDIGGEEELRKIFIPITTAQLVYGEPGAIHQMLFTIQGEDLELSKQVTAETRTLLQERHAVSPADPRAIRIWNNLEEFRRMTEVFRWISGFIWIVAIGTLIAGIVGVGNIMLITVAERTKEIGIRKAVGASSFSIIAMIVSEALLITSLSGYAGLVAGVALVEFVARLKLDLPFLRDPSVDIQVGLIASLLLVLAGMLAGLLPALRAARVDPIVALREGS